MQERENAVKILLEKGADPNTRDKDGRNALMVMSMEHRSINFMYGVGPGRRIPPPPPRPDLVGSGEAWRGMAVRRIAMDMEGRPGQVLQLIGETLLQAGCDVNAADSNGRTPLMYAARYRRGATVRLLLERGANIKARDKDGMTALDLAKQPDNQEVIKLLQSASLQPVAAKKQSGSP